MAYFEQPLHEAACLFWQDVIIKACQFHLAPGWWNNIMTWIGLCLWEGRIRHRQTTQVFLCRLKTDDTCTRRSHNCSHSFILQEVTDLYGKIFKTHTKVYASFHRQGMVWKLQIQCSTKCTLSNKYTHTSSYFSYFCSKKYVVGYSLEALMSYDIPKIYGVCTKKTDGGLY